MAEPITARSTVVKFLQDKQADSDAAAEKNEGYISAADSDSSISKLCLIRLFIM